MNNTTTLQPTLIDQFALPNSAMVARVRWVLLAIAGSVLLTISAKVQVPFWPVPMTMQTFVVLVIGMGFGPRLGLATVLLYLAEGAFGLPVFAGTPAKGIGLAYMAGPTGGYLVGFAVAAWAMGHLARRGWDRGFFGTVGAMLIGTGLIYLCGVTWLSSLIGIGPATEFGLLPFLPADALKVVLAAIIMPLAWRAIDRR